MEFKDKTTAARRSLVGVEIETEWNLKKAIHIDKWMDAAVEIETEWNLKFFARASCNSSGTVEIETEWNLKEGKRTGGLSHRRSRDRNRVEFKGKWA